MIIDVVKNSGNDL